MTDPVDWFRVLADLQQGAGMGRAAVARSLELSESSLKAYYRGAHEPNHADGEKIIGLWSVLLCRPRDDLPRLVGRSFSAARSR